MKALTYVELDLPLCSLTYGSAPCTASLGVTGADRCYNTRPSCQDAINFTEATLTLRFAMDVDYLPDDIDCIPSIKSIALTPSTVGVGSGLGQRASLKVSLKDHRHSDSGIDPYISLRSYDPYTRGTLMAKIRARFVYFVGRPLRLIQGHVGQSLGSMEVRSFIVESVNGPALDGTFEIVGKDILKLADGEKAQCPPLSEGQLLTNLTTVSTTATLTPVGVGALYPASGYVAIGSEEVCSFTRVGDVLTIARAKLGTVAAEHKALDRVQIVVDYVAQSPDDILYDLLVTYGGVPAGYINATDWATEVSTYLPQFLTAHIAEPESVSLLVSEICEQCQLALWWDEVAAKIKLKVLRDVSALAHVYDEEEVIAGSFKMEEQPSTRVSETWLYYGIRNPLESATDPHNYRSVLAVVDLQNESWWGTPSIKKVYSRWVAAFGGSIATALSARITSRYTRPPRRITASLFDSGKSPGDDIRFGLWMVQDFSGAVSNVPAIITRMLSAPAGDVIEAEELVFTNIGTPVEPSLERLITVDSNVNNFDLLATHDSIYPAITADDVTAGVTLRCVVNAGVIVGSSIFNQRSFTLSGFVAGLPITLEVAGRIQGAGGRSYKVAADGATATPGGTALYVRNAITLIDTSGEIWGGGGGGGIRRDATAHYALGGGGAGTVVGDSSVNGLPGAGTQAGSNGTATAGGAGTTYLGMVSGAGGNPGAAGAASSGSGSAYAAGGAAGNAIDGISYVTTSGAAGDRRGPTIN